MRKNTRKLLSLAVALCLALALLPTAAFAAGSEFEIKNGVLNKCTSSGTTTTIPAEVTELWGGAFMNCTNLTDIQVDPGNQAFVSVDGVVFTKDMKSIVAYPAGRQGAYTVPDGITAIDWFTFAGCAGLTSVTIPGSVTGIYVCAFMDCTSLKDIYFGGSEAQWKEMETGAKADFMEDLVGVTIHCTGTTTSTAPANPTNDALTINGAAATPAAYKINDENYFKLRDLAALLSGSESQFSVDWDGNTQSVTMTTGQAYTKLPTDLQGKPTVSATANLSDDALYVDGARTDLTVYKVNDNNYFRLRDLGILLDFYVGYENGTIVIDTSRPYGK